MPYRESAKGKDVRKQIVLTKGEVVDILTIELRKRGILPQPGEMTQATTYLCELEMDGVPKVKGDMSWSDMPAVSYVWTEILSKE